MNSWISVSAAMIIALIGFSGCDSDETESLEKKNARILQLGPWMVDQVLAEGKDETETFAGMTLTFMPQMYVSTSGGLLWPESGTWNLILPGATSFERDGEIVVDIITITETNLVLEFSWQGSLGSGRQNSIEGKYTFFFKR